jgi:hypothetical protein
MMSDLRKRFSRESERAGRASKAEPETHDPYDLDGVVHAYPGRPASAVLITMTVRYKLPVLDSTARRRAISDVVDTVFERHRCVLIAFIYLTSEVQLLTVPWGEAGPARMSQIVKVRTANRICRMLRREDPEALEALRRGNGYYFWSAPVENTFFIIGGDRLEQTIVIMHELPVQQQLCASASNWHWSSHRYYHDPDARPIKGLPRVCPVRVDPSRFESCRTSRAARR